MFFDRTRKPGPSLPQLHTLQGRPIELVCSYKYLGFILEENMNFNLHIKQLLTKLKLKLGFYFRNSSCFTQKARKKLVEAMFLPALDYGDVFYRHSTKTLLKSLDSVYHSALRFIMHAKYSVHHCVLYEMVGWSSLNTRRFKHWLIFVYKSITGHTPSYLTTLLTPIRSEYKLRSSRYILYDVPQIKTEFGKTAFSYSAPTSWNELQNQLKLEVFISHIEFKSYLNQIYHHVCDCFK